MFRYRELPEMVADFDLHWGKKLEYDMANFNDYIDEKISMVRKDQKGVTHLLNLYKTEYAELLKSKKEKEELEEKIYQDEKSLFAGYQKQASAKIYNQERDLFTISKYIRVISAMEATGTSHDKKISGSQRMLNNKNGPVGTGEPTSASPGASS